MSQVDEEVQKFWDSYLQPSATEIEQAIAETYLQVNAAQTLKDPFIMMRTRDAAIMLSLSVMFINKVQKEKGHGART